MLKNLLDLDVIVCAGSGGVGKTTMASTLGVWAAEQGKRVLVLTIDPAKRLANALGMESAELSAPGKVEGFPGELHASMIDSAAVFDSFIRNCSPNEQTVNRILQNTLYQQLSTTLSGSQEFTSLEALLQAKESGNYDLIILDTPPSQHAIDFLRAPEKIFSLFQRSITQWFVRSEEQVGFLKKLVNQGTKTALAALESVTGSKFIAELSGFFEAMSELQDQVGQRSIQVHRMLSSEKTGFVLITSLDQAKLAEAKKFQSDLKTAGAKLSMIIVNRAEPEVFSLSELEKLNIDDRKTAQRVLELKSKEKIYFETQKKFLEDLSGQMETKVNTVLLPEVAEEIVGVEGLRGLAALLSSRSANGVGQ